MVEKKAIDIFCATKEPHMALCVCQPMKSGFWFPLAGRMRKFYAGLFDHVTNPTLLRISRKPASSHSTLYIGYWYTPHVIIIVANKRRIDINYPHKFWITARNFYFWYEIKGTSESVKTTPSLGHWSVHFCLIFKIFLVTQSLYNTKTICPMSIPVRFLLSRALI